MIQIRPRCPRCASPLHRRHRNGIEKLISHISHWRPYYCKQEHCHWQGWQPFPKEPTSASCVDLIPPAELIEEGKWRRLSKATLHYLPHGSHPQPRSLPSSGQ